MTEMGSLPIRLGLFAFFLFDLFALNYIKRQVNEPSEPACNRAGKEDRDMEKKNRHLSQIELSIIDTAIVLVTTFVEVGLSVTPLRHWSSDQ